MPPGHARRGERADTALPSGGAGAPTVSGLREPAATLRRCRTVLAAAGVAAAAAGSMAAIQMASNRQAAPPEDWSASAVALSYRPVHSTAAITALVQVFATGWGSKIQLRREHVQSGYLCSMVVIDLDGHRETGGTWSAPAGGSVAISGSAPVGPERIASVQVDLPNGVTLISLNRPGDHLHH